MSFFRSAASGVRSLFSATRGTTPPRVSTPPTIQKQTRRYCDEAPEHKIICIEDYDQFRDAVLNSSYPVLVAFHADWSGPCQMYIPRVENAAMHYDLLTVAKVNIDYCSDVAQEYGVENVPTLISFNHGEEISRSEGVLEEDNLYNLCEHIIEHVHQ
uniref:Thioredoxin domain-containing protein n=1 Tax=Panagrolaimus superbus TaxID=310955 RepID=A0A914XT38_9BILA